MKLHRYVDHQRLHIVTKDVISLSISVLLLFRHYISHKITFGAPSSGGVLRSACGAFIEKYHILPCFERNFTILASLYSPGDWFESLFFWKHRRQVFSLHGPYNIKLVHPEGLIELNIHIMLVLSANNLANILDPDQAQQNFWPDV